MPTQDSDFLYFVLDQLQGLRGLQPRAMFGAHGIYLDGVFFAIVSGGRLYFKTSPETRERYIARGSDPFRPNEKQALKSYYEVPIDVLEDHDELASWAIEASKA